MKAIEAIKQAINNGASAYRIGKKRQCAAAAQFALRLGFSLPDQYWTLLSFADGLILKDRVWFSFLESVDCLILFQTEWIENNNFWPLSDDGCGNYYCVPPDGTVVFIDTMESCLVPTRVFASTIDDFLLDILQQ
jgi:hypothetical protein